jgi:hypothetical protein
MWSTETTEKSPTDGKGDGIQGFPFSHSVLFPSDSLQPKHLLLAKVTTTKFLWTECLDNCTGIQGNILEREV